MQWDSPPLCWLWGAAEGAAESWGAPAQSFPGSLPCCTPPCHPGSRLRAGPSLPRLPGLPCQTGAGIGASVPCLPGPCLCPGTCPPPANTPASARGPELSVFQGEHFHCQILVPKSVPKGEPGLETASPGPGVAPGTTAPGLSGTVKMPSRRRGAGERRPGAVRAKEQTGPGGGRPGRALASAPMHSCCFWRGATEPLHPFCCQIEKGQIQRPG